MRLDKLIADCGKGSRKEIKLQLRRGAASVNGEIVKNGDFKVEAYLASKGVKLIGYVRFEKGEGLAKKEENFADEVASMINK